MTTEDMFEHIKRRLEDVEKRLQEIEMKEALAGALRNAIDKRLGKIEDTLKWLVRLAIGALLVAVLDDAVRALAFVP
jgi:Haemolysin XhlA.